MRPAIRQWLAENDPEHEIRCLVTVWGVPLAIGPAPPSAKFAQYQAFLAGERAARLDVVQEAIREFEGLVPAGAISTHSVGGAPAGGPAVGSSTPETGNARARG